jgi:hypothetical protein
MNSTASLSVEARSLATLKIKVAARKAFGWSEDGEVLVVTDYTKSRPVKRYAQVMYRSPALSFHQMALQ